MTRSVKKSFENMDKIFSRWTPIGQRNSAVPGTARSSVGVIWQRQTNKKTANWKGRNNKRVNQRIGSELTQHAKSKKENNL